MDLKKGCLTSWVNVGITECRAQGGGGEKTLMSNFVFLIGSMGQGSFWMPSIMCFYL